MDKQNTRDISGRRKFISRSRKIVHGYQPSAVEQLWLTYLNVHGLASSELLFELTRNCIGARNRHNFSEKLLRLWEAGLVFKPEAQRATVNADNNFHVYDLTDNTNLIYP